MHNHLSASQQKILFVLALVPGLFWIGHAINLNMWWDEVSSLRGFILVEPLQTVTNYQEANNHVFFNLISNFLTLLFGKRDFLYHIQHPYLLRLPFILASATTALYVVKFSKRFLEVKTAAIPLGVLLTTIPFLNYSLQLRGYGLSMMLSIMLLYYVYSFIKQKTWINTALIILTAFGLLYTIPSNVYLFFGIGILMLKQLIIPKKTRPSSFKAFMTSPQVLIVFLITIGVGVAVLAYYPILDNILNNRTVSKTPAERGYVLKTIMPAVLWAIISWRVILFIPILKNVKQLKVYPNELLLIPISVFVFSFGMNHMPFERTFANLIPIFALYLTGVASHFIDESKNKKASGFMVVGYLLLTLFATHFVFQFQFKQDLKNAVKEQGMLKNYAVSSHFKFNDETEDIGNIIPDGANVLLTQEEDRPGIMYSLHGHGVYPFALNKIQKDASSTKKQTVYRLNIHEGNHPELETPYKLYNVPMQGLSDFRKSNFTPLFILMEQVVPSKEYYFIVNYQKAFEKEYSFNIGRRWKIEKVYKGDYLQVYRVFK